MKHLLAISIGPVQDFIAAARKTADLKAGSTLLSESTQAAVKFLQSHGSLILPDSLTSNAIPNKILIELNDGEDPKVIALQAQGEIQKFFSDVWKKVKTDIRGIDLDESLADNQVAHFLEFYAAWSQYDSGYQESRKMAEELLAARKSIREFSQPLSRSNCPKSPLDPSRDCVLILEDGFVVPKICQKQPLLLKKRETLDAVSLLKRVYGANLAKRNDSIPSTSLMAAESILPIARKEVPEAIRQMEGLAKRAGLSKDFSDFLFQSRKEDEDVYKGLLEAGISEPEIATTIPCLRKEILDSVRMNECPPYYAILVADGDRMGEMLSRINCPEGHRRFSCSMAEFSERSGQTIIKWNGYCVYAGGDDVLALLPVNTAIQCAEELAGQFRESMGNGTLSAGIAIVHHLESLQVSIQCARDAEKEAKKERNSLAVALHTRGGAPAICSSLWSENPKWKEMTNAFRSELAHGFPYELRELAREWKGTKILPETMQQEAKRILRRKKGGDTDQKDGAAAVHVLSAIEKLDTPEKMAQFADRLIIARFLATYPEANNE